MAVRVKICGITNEADARVAMDAGADALGFVFTPESPRRVTTSTAANIIRTLPAHVAKVGLFVNATPEQVRAVLAVTGIDTLQFHGDESPAYCQEFRGLATVWKAFRIRSAATLAQLPEYAEAADVWLLDAYVAGVAGGTGARFDWEHAVAAQALGRPIILAGGLKPENVAHAVRTVRPFAVDVSSGVERAPGQKDETKVRNFIYEAKHAE